VTGRHHDQWLLTDSGILEELLENMSDEDGNEYVIYGDPGYSMRPGLLSPFRTNFISREEQEFNTRMSECRQAVEWVFGVVAKEWAFLDFAQNQKVLLSPVASWYKLGYFLCNVLACMHEECQVSAYFSTTPPTLQEYLDIAFEPLGIPTFT